MQLKRLDELKDCEPIGIPQLVVVEGDLRPCNSVVYGSYLRMIEQIKPKNANAFVEGEHLVMGRFSDELKQYIPIQFYRGELSEEKK